MIRERTVCRSCGDYKAQEGQRMCASCLAELTNNVIPPSCGGDITDSEYELIHAEARARLELGRAEYGNAFNNADLKTDLIEELLDGINYLTMMIARVRRVIPEFEGPLSKDLIRQR